MGCHRGSLDVVPQAVLHDGVRLLVAAQSHPQAGIEQDVAVRAQMELH